MFALRAAGSFKGKMAFVNYMATTSCLGHRGDLPLGTICSSFAVIAI